MDKLYTAQFSLLKQKQVPSIFDITEIIIEWLSKNNNCDLERLDTKKIQNENIDLRTEECNLESYIDLSNTNQHLALSFSHKGKYISDRWKTEIVVLANKDNCSCSVTLKYGLEGALSTMKVTEKRPSIVPLLLNNFSAFIGNYPLITKSISTEIFCASEISEGIMNISNARKIPLVYCSRDYLNQLHIKPDSLASKIAGTALVFEEEENKDNARLIQRMLPETLRCYNGAVRIYWSNSMNPNSFNRFFKVDELEKIRSKYIDPEDIIATEVLKITKKNYIDKNLRFSDAKQKILQKRLEERIREAKESGTKELEDLYIERINELTRECDNLTIQVLETDEENQRLKEHLENTLIEITNIKNIIYEQEKMQMFSSVYDAVTAASVIYNSNLIIPKKQMKLARSCQFYNPDLIYKSLEWLATDYIKGITNGGASADKSSLNISCKKHSQFEFRAHNSKETMSHSKYGTDYEMDFNGEKLLFAKHLCYGNTKDPRTTCRIAFEYLQKEDKVIIGYIGLHQKNRMK